MFFARLREDLKRKGRWLQLVAAKSRVVSHSPQKGLQRREAGLVLGRRQEEVEVCVQHEVEAIQEEANQRSRTDFQRFQAQRLGQSRGSHDDLTTNGQPRVRGS